MQGEVDGVTIGVELATKAPSATEEFANLALHGRLLADEALFVMKRGVLSKQREAQHVSSSPRSFRPVRPKTSKRTLRQARSTSSPVRHG